MKARRIAGPLLLLLTIASFGMWVHGAVPDVPTGQWLPGPALAQPREGAVSVALDDGRVLVIGGRTASGPVNTVEVFNTNGTMSVDTQMLSPRAGHTATKLPDGRVLVVGGTTLVTTDDGTGPVSAEAVTNSAEVYDVNAGLWFPAASLSIPRRGHTATAAADGHVVVAGGAGQDAVALDSFEVFDPETGTISSPGLLSAARVEHAAAAASGTRVLVVGGRNASGVLGTADIVDVASGSVTGVVLSAPRAGASATTLLNGKVLVAGGSNGENDLTSAEIVDPVNALSAPTGSMAQARRDHQALLLANNNTVLITGGTAAGAVVWGAEQFVPWADAFSATSSPTTPSASAVVSNLAKDGVAWLAAGRASENAPVAVSELYGFATLKTDSDDYAPGTTVVITGSGWQPGETVALLLHEVGTGHPDRTLTAVADVAGGIRNTAFAPDVQHIGVRFYLTARGAASQAQVTFTDAVNSATIPQFVTVSAGICSSTAASGEVGTPICATSTIGTNPGGGGGSTSQNFVEFRWFRQGEPSPAFTERFPASGVLSAGVNAVGTSIQTPDQAGTWTLKVCQASTGCNNSSTTLSTTTLLVAASNRTLTVSGSGAGGGTVTSTPAGISCTITNGATSGTCSGSFANNAVVTLSATPTAGAPTPAGSTFDGWTGDGTGTTTRNLTMDANKSVTAVFKANQTITFGALANKSYADSDFTVSATTSSGLTVSFATLGNCTVTGNSVHITGAGSCTITASQAGNSSYNAAPSVGQTFSIGKAATTTTVTCTGGPFTYTGAAQTPCTATVTGPALNQALAVSYSNNVNAGTVTASATYAESANHLESSDSKHFTIAKAATTTTVTCDAGPFVFNGSAQTPCSATVTGPTLNQTLTVSYSNNVDAGTATASATYTESANYLESSDSKNFTIAKAATTTTVTCDAGPFVFNGSAQTPCSATVTGPTLNQTLTVSYSNNVDAGTATASATYTESVNYLESSDSKNFAIAKAATTTTVTCDAGPLAFNGSAQTPCSATVTGPTLNQTLIVSYSNNVDAGTATASATYTESANYLESSDSKNFTIAKAATTTTVTCDAGPFVFNGSAQTPCSATVTGPTLNQTLTVSYSNNVDAGTATASATYTESVNYLESSDSKNFTIAKAATTTTVTCDAGPFAFNGSAQTPCSATVTGPTLNQTLIVSYSNNVDAGTATASATFTESANYLESSDSKSFTIAKAATTTTVTCDAGPFAFNGSAQTPCSATVTGPTLNQTLTVSYGNNVDAGTATASASYLESANYLGSSDSRTFTIARAPSTTTITCSPTVTYTGLAQEPCTATATGAGNLSVSVEVTYSNNTNAGTAYANASYAGDANHYGSTAAQVTFTIDKAVSATTILCPPTVTYTGAALTPCTATATGAGNLTVSVSVTYSNNTDAGTASANAGYAGDDNHYNGTATQVTFTIDKASSVTAITCPSSVTYTSAALTPCSATATGANLSVSVSVTYGNNTDAGTASANASYAGGGNHYGSTAAQVTFTIDKASSATAITCPSGVAYTGAPLTPCTAGVTGVGGLNQSLTVSYGSNTNPGTGTADASYAGDSNHTPSSDSKTFSIGYGACSPAAGPGGVVLQPINSDGTSVFARKGGSTLPVKFRVCDASGNPIANPAAVFVGTGGSLTMLSAVRGTVDVVNEPGVMEIPDAGFRFSGNQWVFNMATSNLAQGTTYTFRINLASGSIPFRVGVK